MNRGGWRCCLLAYLSLPCHIATISMWDMRSRRDVRTWDGITPWGPWSDTLSLDIFSLLFVFRLHVLCFLCSLFVVSSCIHASR